MWCNIFLGHVVRPVHHLCVNQKWKCLLNWSPQSAKNTSCPHAHYSKPTKMSGMFEAATQSRGRCVDTQAGDCHVRDRPFRTHVDTCADTHIQWLQRYTLSHKEWYCELWIFPLNHRLPGDCCMSHVSQKEAAQIDKSQFPLCCTTADCWPYTNQWQTLSQICLHIIRHQIQTEKKVNMYFSTLCFHLSLFYQDF